MFSKTCFIYFIDETRLRKHFSRIESVNTQLNKEDLIVKFLINQSIGISQESMSEILSYFEEKLIEEKILLDFALEWIRATKIRFEYKKYLAKAQFKNEELAIDECIFLFFLEYDKYIRNLFIKDIKEFEIGTLYEIFFSPKVTSVINLEDILQKYKIQIPTIFFENERININIVTLRTSLSGIIKNDYHSISNKAYPKVKVSDMKFIPESKSLLEKDEESFCGPLLERIIKSYCLTKNEDSLSELESAISQFLSSHFKFGKLYEYNNFKAKLKTDFIDLVYFSAPDYVQEKLELEDLKDLIEAILKECESKFIDQRLDGSAWKNDFQPLLLKFLKKVLDSFFESN
jgi:hypothetical protein